MTTKTDCQQRDQQDPIGHLREHFALPANAIYLNGNSLGAQPKDALKRAQEVISHEWGEQLITSWNKAGWFDLPSRLGDLIAPLIGANAAEIVVTDSTTINLFKALAACLQIQALKHPHKKVIVAERNSFPTDLYLIQGLTIWLNLGYQVRLVNSSDELATAINNDVAAVLLTEVNYRTGEWLNMANLTQLAHDNDALIIWDLCHSAGALPIALNACNADMAVGCTYKYLNAGPGAPAFIWVAERHIPHFNHPLSGWWGHATPFAMSPTFTPTATIRRALCGTQPIISLALVEVGLAAFAQTNMQTIRAKSLALSDLFIQLIESRCAQHQLTLITPREHDKRGSHISLMHPDAYPIVQALIKRGVIIDYREPSVMRFALTPLYTRFIDIWDAVDCLAAILDNRTYDKQLTKNAVT